MRFRFLFVDDRGEEVYVSSTEELARHVRAGSLREEALLYDSVTREWAPARTHPAFPRPDGPGVSGDRAPSGEEGAAGLEDPGADPGAPPGGPAPGSPALEGRLPSVEPLPEDAVQVDTVQLFLKEQELERWEEEKDRGGADPGPGIVLGGALPEDFQPHAPIAGSWGDTPPEPGDPGFESFLNAQRRWGRSQPPRGRATERDGGPWPTDDTRDGRADGRSRGSPGTAGTPRAATPPRKSSALRRWFRRTRARDAQRSRHATGRQFVLLVFLLAVGGWGVAEAWGVSPLETALVEAALVRVYDVPEVPPVPAAVTPGMAEAEAGAFHDMVLGMEQLRRTLRVDEPPSSWMGGPYLSNALGFPEVREFWARYLEYVGALRETEGDLFRQGFVTRMRLQGVNGPVLSIRLARALDDFEADAPRREETYAGMETLAVAALGLHDFLVANAERIRYAPVDRGIDDDPILEAVAEDPATQEALWTRIERLVAALDGVADADPLRRRDVSRSVLGSLALPDSAAVPGRDRPGPVPDRR